MAERSGQADRRCLDLSEERAGVEAMVGRPACSKCQDEETSQILGAAAW